MSDARQREDERIIYRANELLGKREKLRPRAVAELIGAATRMTVRASNVAPAEDEQHECDDGKDDQDRPQHGDDSTLRFGPVHGYMYESGGRQMVGIVDAATATYPTGRVVVMPEDAYEVWSEIVNQTPRWDLRPPVTPEIQAVLDALQPWDADAFETATAAYLASIEPPKPAGPFAVEIADMILRGDSRDEIRRLLNGDPALAIDVVIRLTDKSHRADNVFHYANLVIDILDEQPERTTP